MKAKLAIILGCCGILFSIFAYAGCGGSGGCGTPPNYEGRGCGSANGCATDDEANCSTCQCTDPNAGRNPCLSTNESCEAFGNIGAR